MIAKVILGLLLALSGKHVWPQEELADPSPDICDKLVSHRERLAIAPIARPPFMRLFKEPGFGTLTRRITNNTSGMATKPAGRPVQAWNRDESLMLLHRYQTDGKHEIVLLNGRNYQELRTLAIDGVDSEHLFWSHTDPALLYFVVESGKAAGELRAMNVHSQQQTQLHDFAPACRDANLPAQGGLLARPSLDDDTFGYRCGVSQQRSLGIVLQRAAGSEHTVALGTGTSFPATALPSPSVDGKHVWLHGFAYDPALARPIRLDMADASVATTLVQRRNGDNLILQAASDASPDGCERDPWNGIGLLVEHQFDSGQCVPLINQTDDYPPVPGGTDLFASAYLAPDWLAMASVGYDKLDYLINKRPAPLLVSEIYLARTQAETVDVCRLAHHRSFGGAALNAAYDPSLGEPHVTLSPTATRVLFASDWYDSGFVDTYVLELPSFAYHDVHGQWVDANNHAYRTEFRQQGEQFTFRRAHVDANGKQGIVTSGSGEISGSTLALDYVVRVSATREVSGKCTARLHGDPPAIELDCSDHYFGRLKTRLVRPD